MKVASVCECANLILFIIIDSPLLLKKVHINVFQRLNKYTWSIGNCSIGDSWRSFQFDSLYSRNSYKSGIGFSTSLRFFFNYLTLYKGWPSPSFIFLLHMFCQFLLYHRTSGLGFIHRKNHIWQIFWWCQWWFHAWWTAPNLAVAQLLLISCLKPLCVPQE